MTAKDGNNLFVRRTLLKTKDSVVKSIDFDITVNADHSEIVADPVVNYTLEFAPSAWNQTSGIKFFFENDSSRYFVKDEDVLFKEIGSNKNLHVRFTTRLEKTDFNKIAFNFLPVKIGLLLPDGREILLGSEEVNAKFNDLRIILK